MIHRRNFTRIHRYAISGSLLSDRVDSMQTSYEHFVLKRRASATKEAAELFLSVVWEDMVSISEGMVEWLSGTFNEEVLWATLVERLCTSSSSYANEIALFGCTPELFTLVMDLGYHRLLEEGHYRMGLSTFR